MRQPQLDQETQTALLTALQCKPHLSKVVTELLQTPNFNSAALYDCFSSKALQQSGINFTITLPNVDIAKAKFGILHLAVILGDQTLLNQLIQCGFDLEMHHRYAPSAFSVAIMHAIAKASAENLNFDRNSIVDTPMVKHLLETHFTQLNLKDLLLLSDLCGLGLNCDWQNTPIKRYIDKTGPLDLTIYATRATLIEFSRYSGFVDVISHTNLHTVSEPIATQFLVGIARIGSQHELRAAISRTQLSHSSLLAVLEEVSHEFLMLNTILQGVPEKFFSAFDTKLLNILNNLHKLQSPRLFNHNAKLLLNKCDLSQFNTNQIVSVLRALRQDKAYSDTALWLLEQAPALEHNSEMKLLMLKEQSQQQHFDDDFLAQLEAKATKPENTAHNPNQDAEVQAIIKERLEYFGGENFKFFKKSYEKLWSNKKSTAQNVRTIFKDYCKIFGHPKRNHRTLAREFYRSLKDPNTRATDLLTKLYELESKFQARLSSKDKDVHQDKGSFHRRLMFCIKQVRAESVTQTQVAMASAAA